jgi:hypothetical protein
MDNAPLIVAFVSDLMFTIKIDLVARHLGYRVEWIESAATLAVPEDDGPPESPGERLHGREGRLFDRLTALQPALLLFDLTNKSIPWATWIPALKSSPATRRIPIIGFGPHEDVALMKEAQGLGAELIVGRSRFTNDMPALFERYARVPDRSAAQDACAEPLSDLGREGIELFNAGAYYKAHDSLEAAWVADQGPGRDLYRAMLQIGIAYHQIERGNYRGAVKMLLRVRQWLEPLPDVCRGVDVARLREDAERVYTALVEAGETGLATLDRDLLRPIVFG